MKRFFAGLLVVVMLVALLPVHTPVSAASVTVKPFYALNGKELWEDEPYVLVKPSFYTGSAKEGQKVKITAYGSTDIKTIAQKTKEDFNSRPEGTRYINFTGAVHILESLVENYVYYDKAVVAIREWLEEFLTEYKRIGGLLEGICLDVEYIDGGAWEIHKAYGSDSKPGSNPNVYADIVNDPRYLSEIRPMLEERGFSFYPASKQTAKKTELFSMYTQDSKPYIIWNNVNRIRLSKALDDAVYVPLTKYYPDALISDYQVRYTYGWQKTVMNYASPMSGNSMGVGGVSCFNCYTARPADTIYGAKDSKGKYNYTTPASCNSAAYELTPFNTSLWELNIFKNMYDATPSEKIAAHITYFNYNPNKTGTYANTPYYTETIFHVGMLDPQPFMSYIIEREVFEGGDVYDDPNIGDYGYVVKVVNDIMEELTRVAGASDRKPINIPATWNSKFILSGMYAGGRNIWRITPDTSTGVSLEEFKVKDKAPTFYINGQTITFPQGRIIEDSDILQVGSCGYWVETPADVMPVVTNDTDRYSENPSLLMDFENYDAGSVFDSTAALPSKCWEVSGSAVKVQSQDGDKALALTGSSVIKNVKLPANITAGDSYAKQQAWEVTVTVPNSGELKLLTCADSDLGVKIADGKVYYAQGSQYQQLSGVSLTAGSTYTIKREVDFRDANAFKASYTVYDANGSKLGGVSDVTMAKVTIPVAHIGFSCSNVSGTAYIDDYKMYPTGVTTELEAYDVYTGYELDGLTSNKDTAYRLSWMNASSEYKVAKVYNNGSVVEEIKMAPGQDGVATGVVKGSNIQLSVTTENGSASAAVNYDNGDFNWASVAETIGLASGKSGNSSGGNNGGGTPDATVPNNGNTNTTKPTTGNEEGTEPTDNVDGTTPSGTEGATAPVDGNDSTTPKGEEPNENEPGTTGPVEKEGLSGGVIALIVIGSVLVLAVGGFALCWFVIKPKWLMELDFAKIKELFKRLTKKK